FGTIDSTQNFAIELAKRPHENGSLVIAERQTHGRGRLNRKWISPKGGIWMSILLRPNFEPSYTSLFPMATSLALAVSIEKTLQLRTELDCSNDIAIEVNKVAGILIDASVESNKIDYLIIGIGINFKINPGTISRSIKQKNYGIATLVNKDQSGSAIQLVQQFLLELEKTYNGILTDSIGTIRKEWMKRSSTIGKSVTVST